MKKSQRSPTLTALFGASLACVVGCKTSPTIEPSAGGEQHQADNGAAKNGQSEQTRDEVEEEIEVMLGSLNENNAIRMALASSGRSVEVKEGARGKRQQETAVLLCDGPNTIEFARCVNQVLMTGGCAKHLA